jgi:hypothetical protein
MTLEYGELGKFQLNNRVYNVKNKKIFIQRLDLELEHCGAAGGARTESYATRAHVEPAFSDGKLASTKDSGDRDRDGWTAPARAQIPKRRCLSATYVGRFFFFFFLLSLPPAIGRAKSRPAAAVSTCRAGVAWRYCLPVLNQSGGHHCWSVTAPLLLRRHASHCHGVKPCLAHEL